MTLPSLIVPERLDYLERMARNAPRGDFVELGVYQGGSAERLYKVAQEQGRELYLFDTFDGMPFCDRDRGDVHGIGSFDHVDFVSIVRAMPKAIICKGVFPHTMAVARKAGLGKIAFAHIDADAYWSITWACWLFEGRMVTGGRMLFDDYHALEGAHRAIDDAYPRERIIETGEERVFVEF
jgi:hypothetical protein